MSNTKKIKVKKKPEKEPVDNLTLMVRESLGSMGRSVNSAQEKMLVNVYKSFIVGGVANIIDFILFMILSLATKLNPLLMNAISFVIILIYGIFMSFQYLFPKEKYQKPLLQYVFFTILGFIITEGILYGLVVKLGWYAILIKLLAIILVIFIKWGMKSLLNKKK